MTTSHKLALGASKDGGESSKYFYLFSFHEFLKYTKMEIIKQSVGIDVSKDEICAKILQKTMDFEAINVAYQEFSNNKVGFKSLIKWVKSCTLAAVNIHYCMETTGVYHEKLAHYLYEKGAQVHVVSAYSVKRYAESLNVKSKTDKLDAHSIAQLALERKLPEWSTKQPIYVTLRTLTREKDRIQRIKTIVSNQLHALSHSNSPYYKTEKRLINQISYLDKQIKSIEQNIIEVVEQSPELSRKIEQICTIPGVGFSTVVIVLAETDGFINIRNKRQLTSYAGLDVSLKESGRYRGQSKISKKGNKFLRKALYMPSLSVIQHAKKYQLFYEQLKGRKAKPMIALIAVQRKMLTLIYTLWKKDEVYKDPNIKTANTCIEN